MKSSDIVKSGAIILEGVVLQSGYEDYYDSGVITASLVRGALELVETGADVTFIVNSPGGDPTEGESIRAMIADWPGKTTVKVQGDAMSAASLLIMGADVIEMSEGSIMMVHDPSTVTWGTADEHRASAGMLDVLANTYASVYARRTGSDTKTMRALMQGELWMSPDDAVEQGFADKVTGREDDPAELDMMMIVEQGQTRFQTAVAMLVKASQKKSPPAGVTAPDTAHIEEGNHMSKNKTPATTKPVAPVQAAAPATPEPVNTPSGEDIAMQARKDERVRAKTIQASAAPFMVDGRLTQADVDSVLDSDMTAEAAGLHFMNLMGSREPEPTAPAEPSDARQDETDTQLAGMIGALSGETEGPAMDYRGLRLKNLALRLAGPTNSFNERDTIKKGMLATTMMGGAHGVSDFSYITAEVMNRRLMAEYTERAATWNLVAGTPMSAADFRELHAVRFGGDFQMKPVQENGELKSAVLSDEAEGLKVERRGRTVNITFEAIVNDDMGVFTTIPRNFAMAARRMENGMVWALIRDNAVLKSDSVALFASGHGNLAGSAGAISVTTVGAARKAMWEQKMYGATADDAEAFMEVEGDRLIVPPALETVALQFTGATAPTKDSDKNPYKQKLDAAVVPHLSTAAGGSDTAWYIVSSDLPPISVAYLQGYEAPTVSIVEGMNPRGVTMDADHMFAAAATEFRGAYKNG
jgi:ATP-dependent protease ClpP protease subunit